MQIDASQDTFINRSGDECDDGGNEDGSEAWISPLQY